MQKRRLLSLVMLLSVPSAYGQIVSTRPYTWDDIGYSAPLERNIFQWEDANAVERARYLELFRVAIEYSLQNMGKPLKELDVKKTGPHMEFYKMTPEFTSYYYRKYGDLKQAADCLYKYWIHSKHSPEWALPDNNPYDTVLNAYEEAGMYKEKSEFYSKAYPDFMSWLAEGTDVKMIKSNFTEYKKNWPSQAESYRFFMNGWRRAKELAKTAKPKALEPDVQNHEWFYSGKQDEVLKALEYYHEHKVNFMLEKALKHKDEVIGAKAREYLGK